MLYNHSAVKFKKRVNENQNSLAKNVIKHWNIHKHNYEILDEVRQKISRAESEMGFIRGITRTISEIITHENQFDDIAVRPETGFRFPDKLLYDKTGHCIEINLALYSALKQGLPKLKTKFLVGKNPKHCQQPMDINDFGIHLMVYFELDDLKYFADAVLGNIFRYREDKHFHASSLLDKRQAASFLLMDMGEDISFNFEKYELASSYIENSLMVDPNNYVAFDINAKIRWNMGMYDEAEKSHKASVEMAPDLMDTWKCLGDFYYDYYVSRKFAKEAYREAIDKTTNDYQIAASLEKRLRQLKMNEEAGLISDVCSDLYEKKELGYRQKPLFSYGYVKFNKYKKRTF